MMDFVQTMKGWRRMCKAIGGVSCEGCELHIDGNDCVAVYEGDMDYAHVERVVTKWVQEHKEPVFPTWHEWLRTVGAIEPIYNDPFGEQYRFNDPIPADIAQKLGIEPKEGRYESN